MGSITKDHQARLTEFINRMDQRNADLGRPFIPELSDMTVEFIQTFVDEVEAGKYKGGSFLKNSAAHIWRQISEAIIIRFPELHRPITKEDWLKDNRLNPKLCKAKYFWDATYVYDFLIRNDWRNRGEETALSVKLSEWRSDATKRSKGEAEDRRNFKFRWGDVEYERLHELAVRCLKDRLVTVTDAERCVQLIFGLSFFTGRRPWEEVGRISVFREAQPPEDHPDVEHADDWLEVEGIGKKSSDDDDVLVIPVFGISSAELVEAMIELRMIESGKSWFSMTRDKSETASSKLSSALEHQWGKFVAEEVEPCFDRCLEAGYTFEHNASKTRGIAKFTAYDLRRLYVSYAFHRYCEYCREDLGIEPPADPTDYAEQILGHQSRGADRTATITYTLFSFVGSGVLPIAGAKNTRFSTRQIVPC
jgi:hypothetical protein